MANRDSEVTKVLLLTLVLNWGVSIAKILLGFFTNTLSVMADGFHSLFDGVSNVVGLIGLRVASKPADMEHPYGHRKAEHLVTVFISLLLAITAIIVLNGVIERIANPITPEVKLFSFAIMLGTLIINIFVAGYEKKKSVEFGSKILEADSMHTRADVLVTISVIIGLVGISLGFPILDSLIALFIVFMIARSAWKIFSESANTLMDSAPLKVKELEKLAMKVEGVKEVHGVKSRGSQEIFVEMHIQVGKNLSVWKGHRIAHKVKSKIMQKYPLVKDATIHVEPSEK